jgi:hypothetical protein
MQVQHARRAGLDVHKKTVVACILITSPRMVRSSATATAFRPLFDHDERALGAGRLAQ